MSNEVLIEIVKKLSRIEGAILVTLDDQLCKVVAKEVDIIFKYINIELKRGENDDCFV